jgi:hypothetical protein
MAADRLCERGFHSHMSALEELSRMILLCRDYACDELSDLEILNRFQSVRVLCTSDEHNLLSHAGQTALTTLVALLSRMGMQVQLKIPEVPLLQLQPPLRGNFLKEALLASSESLITGAIVQSSPHSTPDLVFVLGDTRIKAPGCPYWRLSGSDWRGSLSFEEHSSVPKWNGDWPVGAMVSAALAANEAFKYAMRQLPLRSKNQSVYFEASQSCQFDFGSVPVRGDFLDLGAVDVISAGAISQAALYVLVRIPSLTMRGRVFDDDLTGSSNQNRNMLTLSRDVGAFKVEVVAERCAHRLKLQPVPIRYSATDAGTNLAPRVLVGVDDIPSRWEVQRQAPGLVLVSGTSHFNVSSSAHSLGEPCCGCLHPIDDPGTGAIPTVSFVSFWAGLVMAVRLLREALMCPYPAKQQHLWLTPLRMDQPRAAIWLPVAPRTDCPVGCESSRRKLRDSKYGQHTSHVL